MKFIQIALFFLMTTFAKGQTLDNLMQSIEQNNPRLIALQKWLEAEEKRSETGIYPENPNVYYAYLFGSPGNSGNQQEIEITQSFRVPGYYTSKSAIRHLDFEQKQAVANKEKREILHNSKTIFFNLVFLHKKEEFQNVRDQEAQRLVALLEDGYQRGEISKPAFDKARIYAIGVTTELQKTRFDIEIFTHQLIQLNGGLPLNELLYAYPEGWLLPNLDTLLAQAKHNNPALDIARLNIIQSELEVHHQRLANLPAFEAGYRSETILDQKLQGFRAGITIPLWENTNMVKQARLHHSWSKAFLQQQETEIKTEVTSLYNETEAVWQSYTQIKTIIHDQQVSSGNLELLRAGEISFAEFVVDADFIWNARINLLQIENSYYILLSKLKSMI